MLWDVSWDQHNIIDGSRYSDYVFALLKDTLIVRPTTSKAPPIAATLSPGQETAPIQGTSMTHINHNKSVFNLVKASKGKPRK